MSVLLKGGCLVSPKGKHKGDLRMEGEQIVEVGEHLSVGDSQVEDVSGCFIFPGFIDGHTHLEMGQGDKRTADTFATGTRAAIVGGTTSIVDFACPEKQQSLQEALDLWHAKADHVSSCDYAFHMTVVDWNEKISAEIEKMFEQGVTSFKLYMAYDNLRVRDSVIFEVMLRIREHHGMLGMHCENGDLVDEKIRQLLAQGHTSPHYHPLSRPDTVEAEAVERYLSIAEMADLPVNIVHLTNARALEAALRARNRGQRVLVETCPQYLVLDDSLYDLPHFEGAKYVCSPPLRTRLDGERLWAGIMKGEVTSISTDHCSFNFEGQKTQGRDNFHKILNGLPGVEHRPILIYNYGVRRGKMSEEQMAELLSENIARQFGMYPQKGALLPGSDADVVVWDPQKKGIITAQSQEQNVDYTPYEGWEYQGAPQSVYLRGQKVAEHGKVVKEKTGRFIRRGICEYAW